MAIKGEKRKVVEKIENEKAEKESAEHEEFTFFEALMIANEIIKGNSKIEEVCSHQPIETPKQFVGVFFFFIDKDGWRDGVENQEDVRGENRNEPKTIENPKIACLFSIMLAGGEIDIGIQENRDGNMAHEIESADDIPNGLIELEVGLIEEKETDMACQKSECQKEKKKNRLLIMKIEFYENKQKQNKENKTGT